MSVRHLLFYVALGCGLLLASRAQGQGILSGQVRDSLTQEPLAFASVFLASTTRGATTDEQGRFTVRGVPAGSYDLIVSYVGYKLYKRAVVVRAGPQPLTILLTPVSNQLQGVVVRPNPNREADFRKFAESFLGHTTFSRECRIRNPDDVIVLYDAEQNELTAVSPTFLQIDNQALGYRIKYYGLHFTLNFRQQYTSFYGWPVFEEMQPRNERQQKRWLANRQQAYQGSLTHFLASVYHNRVAADGFLVQKLRQIPNPRFPRADSLARALRRTRHAQKAVFSAADSDSLARWTREPRFRSLLYTAPRPIDSLRRVEATTGQLHLRFRDYLSVTYLREPPDPVYRIPQGLGRPAIQPKDQNSLLVLMAAEAEIQPNGQLANPLEVLTEGYWGFEKIGEFLPSDYAPLPSLPTP